MINIDYADGSGRPLRQGQIEALNWINDNIASHKVLAINAATGVGKSLIAETLRKQLGARCVVVTNSLMDQILETYNAAYLKGKSRYQCSTHPHLSCGDVQDLRMPPCESCLYKSCRKTALTETGVYFNPLSLFYLQNNRKYTPSEYMVIDEAHKFLDMISGLASKTFKYSKYGPWPTSFSELDVLEWLGNTIKELHAEIAEVDKDDHDKYLKLHREITSLTILFDTFKAEPENFVVYEDQTITRGKPERTLVFSPISPPAALIRRICDSSKLVILSATMFQHTIDTFSVLGPTAKLDIDSPIPAIQRQIRYDPISDRVNKDTPNEDIAAWIRKHYNRHPGLNTLVHLTYGRAEKIAELLADLPITTHNKDNRHERLEQFKRVGGIFLASACAEGVDLGGDLCRLILIPVLLKPHLGDPAVKKRLAKVGGPRWYELKTLETTVQQAGRGARFEADSCLTIIGDSAFPRYIRNNTNYIAKSVISAINWRVFK
jgi:Rad3-related DNA helicase